MTAAKFLSIYDKVARLISLDVTAEFVLSTATRIFRPPIITFERSVKTRLSFACSCGFLRRRARRVIAVNPARVAVNNSGRVSNPAWLCAA